MKTSILRLTMSIFAILSHLIMFSYDLLIDGVYYNFSQNKDYVEVTYKEILYPSYLGDVTIPEKVTHEGINYPVKVIGENAFYCCEELTNINLPESIDTIGKGAFFYCNSLKNVELPSQLKAIKHYAFGKCYNLSNISLPESVQEVGLQSFSEDSCIVSPLYNSHLFAYMPTSISGDYIVPNGIKNIASGAFENCGLLKKIEIPESVEDIEKCAFRNCEKLEEIQLPSNLSIIDAELFAFCGSLRHFEIPQNITHIRRGAFMDCYNLKDIILPNGINEIGESAFYECTSLENVTLPSSLKTLNRSLFYGCSKLFNVVLPEGLKEIYSEAFYDCQNLSSINFPSSIEYIEQETGYAPFGNCINLKEPLYNKNVFAYMPHDFSGEFEIPEGIKYIGCGAFLNCSSLTSITIPESVTSIGAGAFNSCSGLKSISIPKGIKNIYNESFNYCSSLDDVSLPESIEYIGYHAFNTRKDISIFKIYAKDPPICANEAFDPTRIKNLYVPIGCIEAYKSKSPWNNIEIISENGEFIEYTFNSGPFSWKAIDYDDEADFKVELEYSPYYEGAIEIPSFFSYNSISYKVVSIGENAFYKNNKVSSISLPNTLESIGNQAFLNCYEITKIDIPEKVSNIGRSALSGTNLLNIKLPDGIEYLGNQLLYDCTNLKNVYLPLNLKGIPEALCLHCTQLDNIEIPQFVDSIGAYAFAECYSLKRVRVNPTVPPICNNGVFDFTPISSNCILEVPIGTKNLYLEVSPWKDFYEIIEFSSNENLPENLEAIDLGLSVDWSNINLGAQNPESFGDYYAWAEIQPKNSYSRNNSVSFNVEFSDISGTSFDAATCNWGNGWRMPTREELNELLYNCRWEWSRINGVYGYIVYGNTLNNIFIPASGIMQDNSLINPNNCEGAIWSSSSIDGNNASSTAYHFYNGPDGSFSYNYGNRYLGYCIRPVKDKEEHNSIPTIYNEDSNNSMIYNSMGVLVGESLDDLKYLPSGLYIINGKKILNK